MSLKKKAVLAMIRAKFRAQALLSPRKAAEAAFELFTTPQFRNRKELPASFKKAEPLQFRFQDYDIQGFRWNAAAEKKVLILHGYESSIVNFGQYVHPLVDRGFCVMGFDAPAHGRSSGKQMNVRIYMQFIGELRERFGPIQRYLGHSLGGLSLCLALEQQGYGEDTRAVLIAPATETSSAIDGYFRALKLPASIRAPFDELIERRGGHPPSWFSVNRALRGLRFPVQWWHDEDDDMTPLSDAAPSREARYPNVEFHITSGLGHRRIYRDPRVVAAVVGFLASPPAPLQGSEE